MNSPLPVSTNEGISLNYIYMGVHGISHRTENIHFPLNLS